MKAVKTDHYRSIGKVQHLPKNALDMAAPGVPRQVVEARSYRNETIIFASNAEMAGWGFHFVKQLRNQGFEHWMILSDGPDHCRQMHEKWALVQHAFADDPLSCVFSSFPRSHDGWNQWGGLDDKMLGVYNLWATRWWVALQLLREGTNVLSLDVDAVLLSDIYLLLRTPPLMYQDVIISQNNDNSQSLNCGFVYFNRDAGALSARALPPLACGEAPGRDEATEASEGSESLRNALSPRSRVDPLAVPAAEWVCELMWERLRLYLELPRRKLRNSPAREVLWEQDAWNDVVKSVELRRRVFPWATGYGKTSDLWLQLGYRRKVLGGAVHAEKRVRWHTREHSPMLRLPDEPPWVNNLYKKSLSEPLKWLPLCPPTNGSNGVSARVPPQSTAGIPLALESTRRLAEGRLMIAPVWLASLGNDPESDWAGATPSPLVYVHITNMWKCFPHPCWSKAGRLFWLRLHGFWDSRLDEIGLTPRGAPFTSHTRVLRLPSTFFAAMQKLATATRSMPSYPKVHTRMLAFKRFHAVVHNLIVVAVLLDRKPVIPQVPCELIKALQPPTAPNVASSRFGISHAAFIARGSSASPTCHLTPGTWRPTARDQCYHNAVMHDFDFDRFTRTLHLRQNASVRYSAAAPTPNRGNRRSNNYLSQLRQLCREAAPFSSEHVLRLDGVLSLRDTLVDSSMSAKEFLSESVKKNVRWDSGLHAKELRALQSDCPGALELLKVRKQCVGYFLAE